MSNRILVIDDDPDFCEMLEQVLSDAGYEVEVFPYPILAAEEAFSGEYDLITLDLKMPDFDGSELAQLFHDQTLETPVLVISGYLTPSVRNQLYSAGIRHLLGKPFQRSELLQTIQTALCETA